MPAEDRVKEPRDDARSGNEVAATRGLALFVDRPTAYCSILAGRRTLELPRTFIRCSMPTHVALLRAVNLGSHQQVAMADLRALLEKLGFGEPKSLLQSGNLVFQSRSSDTSKIERALQTEVAKQLGVNTDVFVRTASEWQDLVARNPFPKEALGDPGHLIVMCLKDAPTASAVSALQSAIAGREVVRAQGRQAYIIYPAGIGRSRLTLATIEKKLATRGTGRNWNTVMKLHALLA